MHRCPQCDYAYGHLPGVPEDRFGAFTAAVTCPECAFEIPAGARLVIGSGVEAGAQPMTRARRNRQLLAALAPMGYLLFMSVEGIFDVASTWSTGVRVWDALKVAGLPFVGLVLWRAWVHWTPNTTNEGRAPASFSQRWLCAPGALVVFAGEPTTVGNGYARNLSTLTWRVATNATRLPGLRGWRRPQAELDESSRAAALEAVVDLHTFHPADLERMARNAGAAEVSTTTTEFTAAMLGWPLRTIEAMVPPGKLGFGWAKFGFTSWMTLSWVDDNLWRRVVPKAWYYNVMITGVKPS